MTHDRQQWLRDNLPVVTSVVDTFAQAFGRDNVKVTYASEAGHTIGTLSGGDAVKLSETLVGPMVVGNKNGASNGRY